MTAVRRWLGGVVTAAILLTTVAWGIYGFVPVMRELRERTVVAAEFPRGRERVAPAAYLDLSTSYFLEARALIPNSDTYAAVAGPRFVSKVIRPEGVVPAFAQYALLPRRQVSVDEADWLLCYGCFPEDVTGGFEPAWRAFRPLWSEYGELTIAVRS